MTTDPSNGRPTGDKVSAERIAFLASEDSGHHSAGGRTVGRHEPFSAPVSRVQAKSTLS
jgi:hypothetical protein